MACKIDLELMLDEGGFVDATEIVGFTLDKGPEVSLAPEPYWISMFSSSLLVGAASKLSVSNTFVTYGYLNTKPPTLLIILLQSL